MTKSEALKKAKRRWGKYAEAIRYGRDKYCCHVHCGHSGCHRLEHFGYGSTWEVAFREADKMRALFGDKRF